MKSSQLGPAMAVLGKSAVSVARSVQPRNLRQRLRVAPWFRVRGDRTLRLDYDLTPRSIVFDLGGYEGNWASDIFAMYRCHVYIFEPVPMFHAFISNRFRHNPDIQCFPFGLGPKDQVLPITISDDSSSTFSAQGRGRGNGGRAIPISIQRFSDFVNNEGIEQIDLVKINIEGGEYDLLDHLLAAGMHRRVRNIQVQFHDFVPDARMRMIAIQQQLAGSHHLTYQFPYVWENWERNI